MHHQQGQEGIPANLGGDTHPAGAQGEHQHQGQDGSNQTGWDPTAFGQALHELNHELANLRGIVQSQGYQLNEARLQLNEARLQIRDADVRNTTLSELVKTLGPRDESKPKTIPAGVLTKIPPLKFPRQWFSWRSTVEGVYSTWKINGELRIVYLKSVIPDDHTAKNILARMEKERQI